MDMSPSAQRKLVGRTQREQVEDLLTRYPDITPDEVAEIIRFIKKGLPLEVGLMTASERLRPQLLRFRHDHPSEFSLGAREYVATLLVLVAFIGLCFLLWDKGIR